jgi:hypothetical protein
MTSPCQFFNVLLGGVNRNVVIDLRLSRVSYKLPNLADVITTVTAKM